MANQWQDFSAWVQDHYPSATCEDGVLTLPDGGQMSWSASAEDKPSPLFAPPSPQAASLRCPACGELWPGHGTGHWQRKDGKWYHACGTGFTWKEAH